MNSVHDYEGAIRALNGLQSNAAVLTKLRHRFQIRPEVNVEETAVFLERTGVKVSDLDRLNIIHVAGTKGKGSVCAMTEAILRNQGLKTGFYSSPHLVHVRERIRINGQPISEDKFAHYFWLVYDRLMETRQIPVPDDDSLPSMPAYFKFLTILAFHVFLEEQVDVAIMEVGIGGTYDCTNVLRHPVICAITTLDYDHMNVLGNTLEEIAWQKGGIMKPGSIAITTDQPRNCLTVLSQRAKELQCPLFVSPLLSSYVCTDGSISHLKLGIPGRQQHGNGSLALQLARLWLRRKENPSFLPEVIDNGNAGSSFSSPMLAPFSLADVENKALTSCRWPGRSQSLIRGTTTCYLDGAHTPKSMEACAEWFRVVSSTSADTPNSNIRIFIFHCTSGRKPESLLGYLTWRSEIVMHVLPMLIRSSNISDLDFDCAIFCPSMVYTTADATPDQANLRTSHEKQMEICEENRRAWLSLHSNFRHPPETNGITKPINSVATAPGATVAVSRASVNGRTLISEFADSIDWRGHYPDASLEFENFSHWTRSNGVCPSTKKVTVVFPCISSALGWLTTLEKNLNTIPEKRLEVLVTGSLHLVGGVLAIIDPDLKM